jgi:hypothetical protein
MVVVIGGLAAPAGVPVRSLAVCTDWTSSELASEAL